MPKTTDRSREKKSIHSCKQYIIEARSIYKPFLTHGKLRKFLRGLMDPKPNLRSSLVELRLTGDGGSRSVQLRPAGARCTGRRWDRLLHPLGNREELLRPIPKRILRLHRHLVRTLDNPRYKSITNTQEPQQSRTRSPKTKSPRTFSYPIPQIGSKSRSNRRIRPDRSFENCVRRCSLLNSHKKLRISHRIHTHADHRRARNSRSRPGSRRKLGLPHRRHREKIDERRGNGKNCRTRI